MDPNIVDKSYGESTHDEIDDHQRVIDAVATGPNTILRRPPTLRTSHIDPPKGKSDAPMGHIISWLSSRFYGCKIKVVQDQDE